MYCKPTEFGGRLLAGKTPHGDYRIVIHRDHDGPVYDADGNQLGTVSLTIKEPPPPKPRVLTEEQVARVARRKTICRACEHMKSESLVTVKCDKCKTCQNAKDLLGEDSTCPLGKWGPDVNG